MAIDPQVLQARFIARLDQDQAAADEWFQSAVQSTDNQLEMLNRLVHGEVVVFPLTDQGLADARDLADRLRTLARLALCDLIKRFNERQLEDLST